MVKNVPHPFGIPLYKGVKRRIAKKIINRYGRDMLRRFEKFDKYRIGDLVMTCSGLNSRVIDVEPVWFYCRSGRVLIDLEIITDQNICSMYHCGVSTPVSYDEAIKYRDDVVKIWRDNDIWGFALRYSNMIIHKDGTYTEID